MYCVLSDTETLGARSLRRHLPEIKDQYIYTHTELQVSHTAPYYYSPLTPFATDRARRCLFLNHSGESWRAFRCPYIGRTGGDPCRIIRRALCFLQSIRTFIDGSTTVYTPRIILLLIAGSKSSNTFVFSISFRVHHFVYAFK